MKWAPGVDFINVLRTAFRLAEPKSIKKTSQVIGLFTLSGSTSVKAKRKYVGKIDSWTQFYQTFFFVNEYVQKKDTLHQRCPTHSPLATCGEWLYFQKFPNLGV